MSSMIKNLQELRQDDIIIAFMGPTGAGKSNFIDLLCNEGGRRSGHSLKSTTAAIQATRIKHPETGIPNIVLVDTPGFDDTFRSDMEILTMISDWLEKTYKNDIKLSGLVYFHAITDARMTGSAYKNLRTFASICGDAVASRIILVSTKWQVVDEMEIAEQREAELVNEFWRPFIEHGSCTKRLNRSDGAEAWGIVEDLIKRHKDREVLLLQEELVNLERKMNETEAGKTLYAVLQQQLTNQNNILSLLVAHTKGSADPEVKKLEKDCKRIRDQLQNTLNEAKKLKIPLGRRIQLFFFGKRSHAQAVKISERLRQAPR